jgi:hypothetical protein
MDEAPQQASLRSVLLSWFPSFSLLKPAISLQLFFILHNKTWTCAVCTVFASATNVFKKGHRCPSSVGVELAKVCPQRPSILSAGVRRCEALHPKWLDSEENNHILSAAVPGVLFKCSSQIAPSKMRRIGRFVLKFSLLVRRLPPGPIEALRFWALISLCCTSPIVPDSRPGPYWTIGQSTLVILSNLSNHAATRIRIWLEECDRFHLDCKDQKIPVSNLCPTA